MPATFYSLPSLRQIGLMNDLLIQTITQHNEEYGAKQVVDYYFDTFVQLTIFIGKNRLPLAK
jgi:hypothetical protein